MKIKGHTVGTPPPLNQKADYDAVFGYNLFNGGATRTENGITITATSLSASGTWDNLATTTTLAQFCPRAVVGRKYVITYVTRTDMPGNKLPIGVMEGGVIKWLPSGTEFVFTEEVAGSGLYLFMGDMGGGFGEFYASYIMVSEEEREYEPSVTLGKSLAVGKLDKVNSGCRLYATNGSGEQTTYFFSADLTKMSFPMRKSKGEIETGTATAPNDAVPLAQMNEALAEKDVEIGILKKRVVNLEQGITPDPFYTDDTVAYVKTVPANALPYARLEAVGGMTNKIITELPIDPAYNLYADEGNQGAVTEATIQEMFPGAAVGATYTLVFDAGEEGGDLRPVDADEIYELGNPFTLVEGARLRCYAYAYNGNAHTGFSNVRLVEEVGLRETKVTAIESVGKNLFDESAVTGVVSGNESPGLGFVRENDYLKITRPLYSESAYMYPTAVYLRAGQAVKIMADCYVVAETAPTLQIVCAMKRVGSTTRKSTVATLTSADTWERLTFKSTAPVDGLYYVALQPSGNAQYTKCDLRIKNISVITYTDDDTTDTEYIPYRKHTFPIPAEVQALDGYGETGYSIEWDDDGKAYWVTPEGRTDISHLITRDNFIPVEGGGVIIAVNENADAAPTAIKYQLKEG